MNNDLSFKCEVILDNKYKKVLSEKIALKDEKSVDFKFSVCGDGEYSPAFNVLVKFEEDDSNQGKIKYQVDDDNITLNVYNIRPNPNNEYTIFSNKKEIIEINNKKYYIEPRITVYTNLFKQVYLDLYEEIN